MSTKSTGSNLVELVIVLPFMILIVLAVIQFGFYWRTFQTIESIALNGVKVAASAIDDPSTININEAKNAVISEMNSELYKAGLPTITTNDVELISPSQEPYGFYQSPEVVNPDDMQLILDYRNPITNGVVLQLSYGYKPIFGGTRFPVPGGPNIIIVPEFIIVTSSQIQQFQRF